MSNPYDPPSPDVDASASDPPAELTPDDAVEAADGPVGFWTEDLLAILLGWTVLIVSLTAVWVSSTAGDATLDAAITSPMSGWFAKPGGWTDSPLESFAPADKPASWPGTLGVLIVSLLLFGLGEKLRGGGVGRFAIAFAVIFALGTLAYVLAGQSFIKQYNLEYALWALMAGLLISNTVGAPDWLRPAMRTEFYVKTGLVLLGGEILMSRLMELGLPGVFVAWIVTPIVLITTYWFGQRVLKIESRSLNMVISSDMSVCGVSAAIASAAACKAKKEELSLAIGMSLTFTVGMMVAMPAFIKAVGMDPLLGGAWMGGTIDATGAVAAAGEFLGDEALQVAATVKMIQNILIGVVAFGIAVYWTTRVERNSQDSKPGAIEIWRRFPKFILGFILASILCSLIHGLAADGPAIVETSIKSTTKVLRGWFFCLAFVSIGLETNFRDLSRYLQGGKPLILYVAGQSLNLVLTLAMAYLMFKVVFAP